MISTILFIIYLSLIPLVGIGVIAYLFYTEKYIHSKLLFAASIAALLWPFFATALLVFGFFYIVIYMPGRYIGLKLRK